MQNLHFLVDIFNYFFLFFPFRISVKMARTRQNTLESGNESKCLYTRAVNPESAITHLNGLNNYY
jgi:hypothetical protein